MTDSSAFELNPGDGEQTDNGASVYEDLRSELSKKVDVEHLRLVVPQRPNIEVAFEPDIEFDLLRMFMKKATVGQGKKKEFDPLRFAYQVMTHTMRGLYVNGKEATENGDPVTFGSPGVMQMLGSSSPQQTIRKLYGKDGHIISTSQRVLEEAGYGDFDIEEGDEGLTTG